MKTHITILCLIAIAFAGVSLSRADDAKSPTTAPATQPGDVTGFAASDHNALIAMNAQKVSVEGIVSEIFDASPRVLLIRFKDNDSNGFVGVAFNDSAPKVHEHFESPEGKALVGKTIRITGPISLYHGNPEIIITDLNEVEVVDAPSTRP